MMKGVYSISQGGEVVERVENVITNSGKKQLIEYIGKMRDGWAQKMVFGVGSGAASATNEWMGLEVYDCPVYVSKVDSVNQTITLKASIDIDAQFRFQEIGIRPSPLFSDGSDSPYQKLSSFTDFDGWVLPNGAGYQFVTKDDSTSFGGSTRGLYVRDSSQALLTGSTAAQAYMQRELDLSAYPSSSKVLAGVVPLGAMNNGFGTKIVFSTESAPVDADTTKGFGYTLAAGSANSYNIIAITKSTFSAQGGATSADWANINSIIVRNWSLFAQQWDTIRIERQDNSILSDVLFSRATTSLKTKWAGIPLDIEYTVTLGL